MSEKKISKKGYFGIVFVGVVAFLIGSVVSTSGKTYTMDLFSLISFGLAIASIFLGAVSLYFAWELFKKSAEATDKMQEMVSQIKIDSEATRKGQDDIVKRIITCFVDQYNFQQRNGDSGIDEEVVAETETEPSEADIQCSPSVDQSSFARELFRTFLIGRPSKQTSFCTSKTAKSVTIKSEKKAFDTESESGSFEIQVNKPVPVAAAAIKLQANYGSEDNWDVDVKEDCTVQCSIQEDRLHIHLMNKEKGLLPDGIYSGTYNVSRNTESHVSD